MAQVRADEEAASRPAADATTNVAPNNAPVLAGTVATPGASPARPRRFHGSVVLRSERLSLEFGRVVQEIVQHVADSAATVEVTVEIAAHTADGFDEAVIRTVTENARTLHFTDQGFEQE